MKNPLRLALVTLALAALAPASSFAAEVDDLDWQSHSHFRLGGGWYASPWEGTGLDGYQLGLAYHYEAGANVLIGPVLNYTGVKAELPLSDLPVYANREPTMKLRVHQTRLGVKALLSPMPKVAKPQRGHRGKKSVQMPLWFYGAIDTGLAIHYVTERDEAGVSFSDSSGDWYLKPGVGVLLAPSSPVCVFAELGYTLVPTYHLMDKQFSFYGAPERVDAGLNTDGFVLEAGLAFQF